VNRILIAEDEPRVAAFLDKGLRASGFSTTIVADGVAASLLARDEDFDLLVLDLGLAGQHGFQVLRQLRGRGQRMPVIILTARDDVRDKVQGFEEGADDYVTKPFRFEELVARIRTRLRPDDRAEAKILRRNGIELDLGARRVTANGRTMDLSAREFGLLETLMEHPDQVLTRAQLLSHVWGYDYDPGSNVVDVYVAYLRRKLGAHIIETVRGAGYRFVS
jgi:two-component system, OmpR family, response regulator